MEHYSIVLLLVMGILAFMQFRLKNRPVKNKYLLHSLCTISVLLFLFICLGMQSYLVPNFQFMFYVIMVLLVCTMIYLNEKIEECSIMSENAYFYLGMLLWTVFFLCVVLELRDLALPVA